MLEASSPPQDLRFEVLDLNSNGMYHCQAMALDEAEETLLEAHRLLQGDAPVADAALLEQLRATTLNNLGVVQCHKGAHRKALDHLDAALAIESRTGLVSPTTSLNLCAAHNALGNFDKATQFALQCITGLRETALSRPEEDISVLWGAAWHNLGVAQLNNFDPDTRDCVNILAIFRNAMHATQDLLGPQHPMTHAVHETYRSIRARLREKGTFKLHEPRTEPVSTMFPTLPGASRGSTTPRRRCTPRQSHRPAPELLVSLHAADRCTKYHESAPCEAYITRELADSREKEHQRRRSGQQQQQQRRRPVLPALSGTLLEAGLLYADPHPLLRAIKGQSRNQQPRPPPRLLIGDSRHGQPAALWPPRDPPPSRSRRNPRSLASPVKSPRAPAHRPQRRLSDLLAGDMWIELLDDGGGSSMPGTNGGGRDQRRISPTRALLRPAYAQALYVGDASASADDGMDRVVEPASHAVLDSSSSAAAPEQNSAVNGGGVQTAAAAAVGDGGVSAGPADAASSAATSTPALDAFIGAARTADVSSASPASQYPGLLVLRASMKPE